MSASNRRYALGVDWPRRPHVPMKMTWGNRSSLIRDPDGNLVNLFTRP